jgi:hypothetical protein
MRIRLSSYLTPSSTRNFRSDLDSTGLMTATRYFSPSALQVFIMQQIHTLRRSTQRIAASSPCCESEDLHSYPVVKEPPTVPT